MTTKVIDQPSQFPTNVLYSARSRSPKNLTRNAEKFPDASLEQVSLDVPSRSTNLVLSCLPMGN